MFLSSDIPIVLIDTYGGTIVNEPKINADINGAYNIVRKVINNFSYSNNLKNSKNNKHVVSVLNFI